MRPSRICSPSIASQSASLFTAGNGPAQGWRLRFAGVVIGAIIAGFASAADHPAGHVVTAELDSGGALWRLWATGEHIQVDVSHDLGATFTPPVRINPTPLRIRVHPEGRPQIAFDQEGGIFVAFNADDDGTAAAYVSYSADGGRTFSNPVTLPKNAPPPPHLRLALHRSTQGDVILVLLDPSTDQPSSGDQHGILYMAHLQGGTPPGITVRKLRDSLCECCRLDTAALPDGGFLVAGRMVFPGMIRDIGMLRINNSAGLAERPVRVTNDDWNINACPEHGPAIALGTHQRVHLTWFTQGAVRQGLFYAYTDLHDGKPSEPVQLGNPARLAGHADVLSLGDRVVTAWREYDGSQNHILVQESLDSGDTWSGERVLASSKGAADYPLLLSQNGSIYVSWYAQADGYRLISLESGSKP